MRRSALAWVLSLIAAAALSIAVPSTGSAATSTVRFGIGDQHPAMFNDARWSSMGLRITRYFIPWDAAGDDYELQRALNFVRAARAGDVEVLLHVTGRIVDGTREPLPSRAAYGRQITKLIAIFRPLGVRTWGVWNEENHPTQPTFGRPDRAAQFFLEMTARCRGCTVVALDLLTQGGIRSVGVASYRGYTRRFFAALGRKASLVKVIGLHNYGDLTVSKGAVLSRDLITYAKRFSPRARFWITESGGIASNRSRVCSESRQVTGTTRMFSHAAALAKDGVDRLYMYNWTAEQCRDLHDSGLVREDGSARPALAVVQEGSLRFSR